MTVAAGTSRRTASGEPSVERLSATISSSPSRSGAASGGSERSTISRSLWVTTMTDSVGRPGSAIGGDYMVHAHEGGDPRGRARHAVQRGDLGEAEADGRGRRPTEPLARHEAALGARRPRVRDLPGLPRL